MARTRKTSEVKTEAYRHTGDKRKNIPSAKIAAEGKIPQEKKARYYYSPHLSPELRFDPTGEADRILRVAEAAREYATGPFKAKLEAALQKNQPWLEWAGKKEEYDRGFFNLDPVALHIHERVSAQAIVRTALREDAQRDLFADPQLPYQKEVQFYQHDVDWANRLILGDSLQVMSSLARRENLAGKVQMIYIDPPYGVSFKSNFQPEIRKRSVGISNEDLTREAESVKAYRDTWTLGLHSYLTYLKMRLIVARELLSCTGSIFVQISDENVHLVRALLDEVFRSENEVATIAYKKAAPETKTIKNGFNYILWYATDISKAQCFKVLRRRRLSDGTTDDPKKLALWLRMPDGFERPLTTEEKREVVAVPEGAIIFRVDKVRDTGVLKDRIFPLSLFGEDLMPGSGFVWRGDRVEMKRLRDAERLVRTDQTVGFKLFKDDSGGVEYTSLWEDTAGKIPDMRFVVQTNDKIIARCMMLSTKPGDLVLDPTCGSGTTASVAEQFGRRWITIDTSRVALAIARERLLTNRYEYFLLCDPTKGPAGRFNYEKVPSITLKSIAQNQNLDPILAKHESILDAMLTACNKALAQIPDSVRERCRQKLIEKPVLSGNRAISEADRRRWELPKKGGKWEHWEVPFDTDMDWPKELRDAVTAYRKAWRAKTDEVNACISANAEQEELVDQPEVVRGIVRVSGPFTVEGVRPEELSLAEEGLFDGGPAAGQEEGVPDIRDDVQNLRAYLFRMVELIRKDGVTFTGNKFRKFARVTALFEERSGAPIHAAGIWEGTDASEPDSVAIAFGPQYGPVTAQQVEDIIRASKRHDELVIAGFSFDGEAAVAIQEASHPTLKIHMAHIRPDVSPGMDGLLKDTPNSQLFSVFGLPEIKVKKHGKEEYEVELLGVDIFDPLKGEVRSTGAEKVAAWFLDSDYDGRCFCITQAFFPDQSAWEKIAKALGSQADEDAFAAFAGTVSLPFKAGKYKRVAVKVIDPRGNEVMAFRKLEG